MKFSEIKPFVRHAQKLVINEGAKVNSVAPRDCRLFFCTEGEGEIFMDGVVYKMQKGALVIIPAGVTYAVLSPAESQTSKNAAQPAKASDNDDTVIEGEEKAGAEKKASPFVTYIVVNYDYTQNMANLKFPIHPVSAQYFKEKYILERVEFSDITELNLPIYLPRVHRVENKLNKIFSAYTKKVIFYEMETSGIFSQVLIECMRCIKLNALNRRDTVFDKVFEYIHENSHRKLTNKEIADAFGYNPNYISDLLKISTGLPLHKYLLGVRIEKAIDLIELGEKSIGEIADECGFYDIYHFSKAFKAATGVSPSKYHR